MDEREERRRRKWRGRGKEDLSRDGGGREERSGLKSDRAEPEIYIGWAKQSQTTRPTQRLGTALGAEPEWLLPPSSLLASLEPLSRKEYRSTRLALVVITPDAGHQAETLSRPITSRVLI